MKIELQVTSPGTSNVLKNMGVTLKSDYVYRFNPGTKRSVLYPAVQIVPGSKNITHAYTIAELGMMIPWGFFQASPVAKFRGGIWTIDLKENGKHNYSYEVEARAYYLIDLIYTKQVDVKEVNNPEKYNQPVIRCCTDGIVT